MSHNVIMSYEKLININKQNFRDKGVILIGAGWMSQQYCLALSSMSVSDVTVISRKEESARKCAGPYGFKALWGGYEKALPKLKPADLVIVSTSIQELQPASEFARTCGHNTILVEKPGSLYSSVIEKWAKTIYQTGTRIRFAYNRLTYPSLWKLKSLIAQDGGITSCCYAFTEWVHTIDFSNNPPDTYRRWGIANSLHLIGMAHSLIGMPRHFSPLRFGSFPWHPSGCIFVGSGITDQKILFSYHANWSSAGRWGIEIMTPKNAYRLIPLESLYVCPKGSVQWEPVDIVSSFPKVKTGVAEEIAVMLEPDLENDIPLVTLDNAASLTELAEKICGYSSEPDGILS